MAAIEVASSLTTSEVVSVRELIKIFKEMVQIKRVHATKKQNMSSEELKQSKEHMYDLARNLFEIKNKIPRDKFDAIMKLAEALSVEDIYRFFDALAAELDRK